MNEDLMVDYKIFADLKCRINLLNELIKLLNYQVKNFEAEIQNYKKGGSCYCYFIKSFQIRLYNINTQIQQLKNIIIEKTLLNDNKNLNSSCQSNITHYVIIENYSRSVKENMLSISKNIEEENIKKLGGYRKLNNSFLIVKNRKFNCDLCYQTYSNKNEILTKYCSVEGSFIYKNIGLVFKLTSLRNTKPNLQMMIKCGLGCEYMYTIINKEDFNYIKIHQKAIVNFKSKGKGVYLSYQTTYGNFFPSVPGELTGQSFPVTLKTNASSDLVIVKCPGSSYRHIKTTDHFSLYGSSRERNLYYHTADEVFTWAPMLYNSSMPSFIHCGKLLITKDQSSSSDNYEWTFNLNWENQPDPVQIMETRMLSKNLPSLKSKCDYIDSMIVVYHKDKKSSLKKLEFTDKVISHVNDLFYYFEKPDSNNTMEVMGPCGIVRAVNYAPQIIIKEHASSLVVYKKMEFHVIKKERVTESYLIKLYIRDDTDTPDFYDGETITMKKMKLTRTGIEEVKNSDEDIISSFTIKGFQLLEFSYNCPTAEGTELVKKVFYFGPPSKNYVFPNEDTVYLANETAIQPNCSVHGLSFGYLDSVTVAGVTTKLNDLPDNGAPKNNLKRVEDFIFMADVTDDRVTLDCFYVTLNGNVTLVQTFIKGKKVVVGHNYKGEKIYEAKMENDKSEEYEKKLAEKDKQLAAKSKTSFEKLKDKVGTIGAFAVVIISGLVILIITLMIAIFGFVKILKPWIIRRKIQSKHPNIFILWDKISSQSLEVYAETIKSKQYIPDKLKNQVVSRRIEGGEIVESNTNVCFDSSLVKCYNDIRREIKAHYISGVSPIRTYIISDGPAPDKVEFFWELLYREDVAVAFAIIFQEQEMIKNDYAKLFYWPQKKQKYGKIDVEFCGNLQSDIPNVTIRKFTMTTKFGQPKELIHFHISNWKEHDIPHSDRHIIKLYKEISEHAGIGKVLVHATHGSGSRVFMFTYFACIFEAMKENDTVDEPLEIIKEVRAQRYGGNISSIEFAYIIKAVISYFFECNMLIDVKNHQPTFYKEYDDFIFKLDEREVNMDGDLKNFLKFANIIDDGKLKDLCDQSVNVQMLSEDDLRLQCKRFYAISNVEALSKNKIRYKDVPCFDKSAVNIRGKGSNETSGFIHANEFKYKYGKKERKIIMCQAPLKESMDDMLDMIHRCKIAALVVLVNKDELDKKDKCFPYITQTRDKISYGSYNLLYRGHVVEKNNYYVEYNYSVLDSATETMHTFKLFHYLDWPDKTIPTERRSLYELYKRIIQLQDERHIVIHCSNGVGRTGTLALIIYMIDIIESKRSFDPIKCLAKIRKHRCKAVQTTPQFVFALSILYEHFKDQIDRMDKKAYDYFMSLADEIYGKNNNK
uniref:Protein-tyrosine-phosphatase n=1 Tax=Strongyloides stercoralis TaxID=6248 RepID=A0AAF5HXA0_STRER